MTIEANSRGGTAVRGDVRARVPAGLELRETGRGREIEEKRGNDERKRGRNSATWDGGVTRERNTKRKR